MGELPLLTVQVLVIVRVLKRSVLPEVMDNALGELAPLWTEPLPPAKPLLEKLIAMQDDAELRLFLQERATVGEALKIQNALELYEEKVRRMPPDQEEFAHWSGALIALPTALHVCQVGLTLLALLDAERPGDASP